MFKDSVQGRISEGEFGVGKSRDNDSYLQQIKKRRTETAKSVWRNGSCCSRLGAMSISDWAAASSR